jgi:hypothetical protein
MMVAEGLFGLVEPYHVPVAWSLGVIATLILGAVLLSLLFPPSVDPHQEVLDNTAAASLIADIDPHALSSSTFDISTLSSVDLRTPPAERSDLIPRSKLEPRSPKSGTLPPDKPT